MSGINASHAFSPLSSNSNVSTPYPKSRCAVSTFGCSPNGARSALPKTAPAAGVAVQLARQKRAHPPVEVVRPQIVPASADDAQQTRARRAREHARHAVAPVPDHGVVVAAQQQQGRGERPAGALVPALQAHRRAHGARDAGGVVARLGVESTAVFDLGRGEKRNEPANDASAAQAVPRDPERARASAGTGAFPRRRPRRRQPFFRVKPRTAALRTARARPRGRARVTSRDTAR